MSALNSTTASAYCQTCLVNFEDDHIESAFDEQEVVQNSVNIQENEEVKQLLRKYIDDRSTEDIEGFPESICHQCCNTLLSFDSFCKQAQENIQKLHDLMTKQGSISKEYMDVEQDTNQCETEKEIEWNDEQEISLSDLESPASHFNEEALKSNNISNIDIEHIPVEEEKTKITKEKTRNKSKSAYDCSQCQMRFKSIRQLNAHVQAYHVEKKKPYQCNQCGKSFSVSSILERHIKDTHNNKTLQRKNTKLCAKIVFVNTYQCTEDECTKAYNSKSGLRKHKRKHLPQEEQLKAYICDQCGATYPYYSSLMVHKKSKHITEEERVERERNKKIYPCLQCEKTYISPYKLEAHVKEHHTDDKPYECHICGKRTAVKYLLKQHMRYHDTASKLPCEYCGRPFRRKFELNEHIKAVHLQLRPFKCKYCNDSFACRKTLRHHEYIHTGEKPYVCEVCGVAYRQRAGLKNHRKIHEQTNQKENEDS